MISKHKIYDNVFNLMFNRLFEAWQNIPLSKQQSLANGIRKYWDPSRGFPQKFGAQMIGFVF